MDIIILLKAAIMGVVEGLTEFLPISSTGHLIVSAHAINFSGVYVKAFDIVIQVGAMLALCWELRTRLWQKRQLSKPAVQKFWLAVLLAFLPAALLGLMFGALIKAHLFAPVPVALAFIVGGILILWVEKRHIHIESESASPARVLSIEALPIDAALAIKIGFLQALALIPGMSRSGATIIGGMWLGLPRLAATEFSFYLAIPTLSGAAVYSLYKDWHSLSIEHGLIFIIGLCSAFISAFVCVRWLLRYVSTHTFIPFAWYRIVVGTAILGLALVGVL